MSTYRAPEGVREAVTHYRSLKVQWDQSKLQLTYQDCSRLLREGEPSIEVNASREGLDLASYNPFPWEKSACSRACGSGDSSKAP